MIDHAKINAPNANKSSKVYNMLFSFLYYL